MRLMNSWRVTSCTELFKPSNTVLVLCMYIRKIVHYTKLNISGWNKTQLGTIIIHVKDQIFNVSVVKLILKKL